MTTIGTVSSPIFPIVYSDNLHLRASSEEVRQDLCAMRENIFLKGFEDLESDDRKEQVKFKTDMMQIADGGHPGEGPEGI